MSAPETGSFDATKMAPPGESSDQVLRDFAEKGLVVSIQPANLILGTDTYESDPAAPAAYIPSISSAAYRNKYFRRRSPDKLATMVIAATAIKKNPDKLATMVIAATAIKKNLSVQLWPGSGRFGMIFNQDKIEVYSTSKFNIGSNAGVENKTKIGKKSGKEKKATNHYSTNYGTTAALFTALEKKQHKRRALGTNEVTINRVISEEEEESYKALAAGDYGAKTMNEEFKQKLRDEDRKTVMGVIFPCENFDQMNYLKSILSSQRTIRSDYSQFYREIIQMLNADLKIYVYDENGSLFLPNQEKFKIALCEAGIVLMNLSREKIEFQGEAYREEAVRAELSKCYEENPINGLEKSLEDALREEEYFLAGYKKLLLAFDQFQKKIARTLGSLVDSIPSPTMPALRHAAVKSLGKPVSELDAAQKYKINLASPLTTRGKQYLAVSPAANPESPAASNVVVLARNSKRAQDKADKLPQIFATAIKEAADSVGLTNVNYVITALIVAAEVGGVSNKRVAPAFKRKIEEYLPGIDEKTISQMAKLSSEFQKKMGDQSIRTGRENPANFVNARFYRAGSPATVDAVISMYSESRIASDVSPATLKKIEAFKKNFVPTTTSEASAGRF